MSDQTYTTQPPPIDEADFPDQAPAMTETAEEHYAGGFSSVNKQDFASNMLSLKTLPHSIEAERSLLGGIMLSETAWDAVSEMVTSSDFYYSKHGHIFTEMARLADATEPLDVITLAEALQNRSLLETVGGLSYLADLAESTPSAANIRAYAEIVHDRATLRRVINLSLIHI